jgi:hypothetical protein
LSVPLAWFVIVLIFIAAAIYSTYKKRGQIFCYFEGEDGTDEYKWVKYQSGYVIFRNYKFKVMTERITNMWYKGGIHLLFPTRVPVLKYSWYSEYPHDPKNFGRTVVNPQVRKAINKSETFESYFKTSSPSVKQSMGFMQRWLPLIAIGIVVIVAVYLYNNQQTMMAMFNSMQNQINTLPSIK